MNGGGGGSKSELTLVAFVTHIGMSDLNLNGCSRSLYTSSCMINSIGLVKFYIRKVLTAQSEEEPISSLSWPYLLEYSTYKYILGIP